MTNTMTANAPVKAAGEKGKFAKGMGMMKYGLAAFAALAGEGVIAYGIEQNIYGVSIDKFTAPKMILHWVLTCIVWGVCAFFICRCAKKKGHDLFAKERKKIRPWQWCCIAVGMCACISTSLIDWEGSKVLKEFAANGALRFVFQYIYYMFEVSLVTLIIVFGQKACEVWFGRENIPYGGIIAALTWGLGHWASKGSPAAGIVSALCGLALGSVYLLTNRNTKLSYLLLYLMFVL